jgi:hypothetical protein
MNILSHSGAELKEKPPAVSNRNRSTCCGYTDYGVGKSSECKTVAVPSRPPRTKR